jgi:methanogenic corrinoid protein MtbC1
MSAQDAAGGGESTGARTPLEKASDSLSPVSERAASDYAAQKDRLREMVDRAMAGRADIETLLGGGSLRVMYDNDRNHVAFMATVFESSDFGLLARTLPWVYGAYRSHGYSDDYFPAVLNAWIGAVRRYVPAAHAAEIVPVYEWMLDHQPELIAAADVAAGAAAGRELAEQVRAFLGALLAGRAADCQEIADELAQRPEELAGFYLDVVQPAMEEVGRLWERDEISVAEEHLASAIVSRTMAVLYTRLVQRDVTRGSAVVTAATNEFHDIGSRMAADLLEVDGWDVTFLGANTPDDELLKLVRKLHPDLLGVSVAMPFNLDHARRTVAALHEDPDLGGTRVLVGGRAFALRPESAEWVGADALAVDARDGVRIAAAWWATDQDDGAGAAAPGRSSGPSVVGGSGRLPQG